MESVNFIKGYGKVNPSEDQQTPSQKPKTPQNRNTKFIISLISILLIFALVGAITHVSKHQSSSPSSLVSNSDESLRTVCAVTQHPDSCFTTISSINDPPKADPLHFYNLSLQVTIQELKNLSSLPKSLISRSNDKGTESALKDCMSLFDDSVSQLSRSLDEMKLGSDEKKVLTEMKISDMQTWISAAMTDQDTCLDGLEEMGSTVLDEVKMRVQKSRDYMSNSLAILNNLESLLTKFGPKMP